MTADAFFVVVVTCSLAARDVPSQVINWPQTGSPVICITLGKFKEFCRWAAHLPDRHNRRELVEQKDLTPGFNLYLFDNHKVRSGDGWITLDNLPPGRPVKFLTTAHVKQSFISGAGSGVSRI
jgi:hypothetical protein